MATDDPAAKSLDAIKGKAAGELVQFKEPVWKTCALCQQDFGILVDGGLCTGCFEKREDAERDAQWEAETRREREAKIKGFLGEKGANEYRLERFIPTVGNQFAFAAVKDFDIRKNNLYIHGPVGTGKTHLAGALVRIFIERKKRVEFIRPPQLMRQFRGKEAAEEERLLWNYAAADLLVLDDLGVGRATEFANQILYEIVGLREENYINGLIVTSNLSLAEIEEKSGEARLTDRLGGICEVFKVAGNSMRTRT